MNCKEVRNNLPDFILGKIESKEIEQHIKSCKSCRDEFENIKGVIGLIQKDLKFDEPSEFYWANFLPRLKRKIAEREKRIFVFTLKPIVLSPAIAVLIIGFVFGLFFKNIDVKFETEPTEFLTTTASNVFVEPSELIQPELKNELMEQAVSRLFEKHQLPYLENDDNAQQDINIDEVINRLSNKSIL